MRRNKLPVAGKHDACRRIFRKIDSESDMHEYAIAICCKSRSIPKGKIFSVVRKSVRTERWFEVQKIGIIRKREPDAIDSERGKGIVRFNIIDDAIRIGTLLW